MDAPCDDGSHAEVDALDGRHIGRIWLASNWMELTNETRRNTITHEILHLLHWRVTVAVEEAEDLMRDHEYEPFRRRYMREMELLVDHFATFMADTHRLGEAWNEAHQGASS